VLFNEEGEGKTIRVLKGNDRINVSYFEEGRAPQNNDEVALTREYAEKNGLKLGDRARVGDKDYTLVGLVLFPDYALVMLENSFVFDAGKISVGLLSDDEFEGIGGKSRYVLGGKALGEFDLKEFKEKVMKGYGENRELGFITSITDTKGNMTSGAIYEEIKSGKVVTIGLSMIIASIALLIVAIIIYKILNTEKGQIGVLKALGYSKKEIGMPYFMIILVVTLPMLILGSVVGVFLGEPLRDLYLEFYLLPKMSVRPDFLIIVSAIVVPLVFFLGFSALIINLMLKKKPLALLSENKNEKVGLLIKWTDKMLGRAKTTTKFKYSFLLRNKAKFMVFLIGIFFSSSLIVMGFMMPSFFSKVSTDYYESKKFVYTGMIDISKGFPKVSNGEEKVLNIPGVELLEKRVSFVGLDENNELHKLYDMKGKDITSKIKDGVVISKSFNMIMGTNVGDEIKVKLGEEDKIFKVVDITEEYGECKAYINRETLSDIVTSGESKDMFNMVYSKGELNRDDFSVVINKNDALEQAESMQGFIRVSLYGIIGSAVFLSVIVLLILTSLTVEDNYFNISLLKVMGYSKKEVNSMILNSYLGYAVFAYLISVPCTVWTMDVFVSYMSSMFDMVMPFEFDFVYGVIGLVIIVGIFFIGTFAGKKKISRISLQEVLKKFDR
ncbi:MAG: FtsX-like permease family protein, partial [Clostridium sp.]